MTAPEPPEHRDDRDEQGKRLIDIFVFVGVVAFYLLISYVLWRFLNHYIQPGNDSAQRRGLVQALGLILVGLAGAIGIYFTWRGQQHAREVQADNQKKTQAQFELAQKHYEHAQQVQEDNQRKTQEELRLTREGQITELFTKAIDQLGNESLETRLGGIYALERIAREPAQDQGPIMEVLTAYVRQRARQQPSEGQGEKDASVAGSEEDSNRARSLADVIPDPDIQAILNVIRRRTRPDRAGESEFVDLHNAHLQGAVIREASLPGAHLYGTDLREANLVDVDFRGAIFIKADLRKADLRKANFMAARLVAANLAEADLTNADLTNADLREANLQSTTGLTQEQVEQALGDETTQLPDYLKRPASWAENPTGPAHEDKLL